MHIGQRFASLTNSAFLCKAISYLGEKGGGSYKIQPFPFIPRAQHRILFSKSRFPDAGLLKDSMD